MRVVYECEKCKDQTWDTDPVDDNGVCHCGGVKWAIAFIGPELRNEPRKEQ
jgi:hypothetical protein